jgi:hypothetical protein
MPNFTRAYANYLILTHPEPLHTGHGAPKSSRPVPLQKLQGFVVDLVGRFFFGLSGLFGNNISITSNIQEFLYCTLVLGELEEPICKIV